MAASFSADAHLPDAGLSLPLMQAGLLSVAQSDALLQQATTHHMPFIDALLQSDIIDDVALAQFCAHTFGYPLLDLSAFHTGTLTRQLALTPLIATQYAIPLITRNNRLVVAISDPTNATILDQIKFQAQMAIEPVIVQHSALLQCIEKFTHQSSPHYQTTALRKRPHKTRTAAQKNAAVIARDVEEDIDDIPVVKYLTEILTQAVHMDASDVHFEPFETSYRIRFRIDGLLREMAQPPIIIKDKLASRIKVLSEMDIAEKRVPQDGRMKMPISKNRTIDFRVSTLPTLFGEKIVMRILDSNQTHIGIDSLGYEPDQKSAILKAIHRPYGMILVTGPTGSGKTISLYTYLNMLNAPGTNISTAEDPAEMHMAGLNQVNINERAGLTFPVALRAFLRQDPDIIMVGEIRDIDTADIAIKAAQTGHLVFSTLHTNDAPSTLTRLINMGVPAFNIASSIIMVTAQRLARKLCSCKEQGPLPDNTLLEAGFTPQDLTGSWVPFRPVGCAQCNDSGYKGRVGIHQMMPISEALEKIILAHGTTLDIETQAKHEGMLTLRQSGLLKVRQGLTSLEEVIGCTNL